MREALAVMVGGAAGSLARWLVSEWVASFAWSAGFPYGILFVNIAGSFGIGVFSELLLEGGLWNAGSGVRALVFAGIFGGFTTFSSFSLQTLALLRSGQILPAGLNIVSSVALCLLAVWLGALLAHSLLGLAK
ncbi:MAG: fluoride efflux transporter CrcB [Terrimicrobiaceae bacterium]